MPSGASSRDSAFVSASPAARETDVGVVSASGALPEIGKRVQNSPTALAQRRQRQARQTYRTHQLQREILLPDRVVMLGKRSGGKLAGVVGHTVDPPPALGGRLDEARQILDASHVAGELEHVSAGLAQPARRAASRSASRAISATPRAPSSTRRSASALPSPLEPPVIRKTLSSSCRVHRSARLRYMPSGVRPSCPI